MDALSRLQDWYRSQCNGEWEHGYGVHIGTLDNPGWTLDIELRETSLEGRFFSPVSYGLGSDNSEDDWMLCEVRDGKFFARGGPKKLETMVVTFLNWAESKPQ